LARGGALDPFERTTLLFYAARAEHVPEIEQTMADGEKRLAIQNLVETGTFELTAGHESTDPDIAGDEPLDPAWLAEIRERRRALEANPDVELARFRDFYNNDELTKTEVDGLLAAMETAIGTPEHFYDELEKELTQEGLLRTIAHTAGCSVKIPRLYPAREPTHEQKAGIIRMKADYGLDDIRINPNDHRYEFCDPGWWHLWRKGAFDVTWWPKGLAQYSQHSDGRTFVYSDTRHAKSVALFSDFGVGQYHSFAIARALETTRHPYVFHLGDVYYGGSEREFEVNYAQVLDKVMNQSTLFSMPENHELYSGGHAWQSFLQKERQRGRIQQEGSYFCVRFDRHQIIALDVNWHGRSRFRHPDSQSWLRKVLYDGRDLTTVLLTGSAPYVYGSTQATQLFRDIAEWHELGLIHLWIWGNDHYCALFDSHEKSRFVGSCIGHGGFPGARQVAGQPSYAPTRWIETEPRFPSGYDLRQDLGNNGWVELALLETGGVELLYIDWLGCKRMRARFELARPSPARSALTLSSPLETFRRSPESRYV
jgi:hypothetical protein